MPAVVTIATGDIPANTTQIYQSSIVDYSLTPVAGDLLSTLTLTICDTLSGVIINNCLQNDILNIGRGTVDQNGLLTVTLSPADTDMSEVPGLQRVQRSLIFDFTYNFGASAGRHQVNFFVVQLAGP